ncbi:ABC transporter permease [Clostridiales bacterium COT073_COT-073]|nr:ABC transporter permease [Clostridiales bacterium COT073_COT-073]
MLQTIISKELKRIFSDKRLIFSTFLLPALSIFLMYNLMGILTSNRLNDIEKHTAAIAVIEAPDSFKTFMETYADRESYQLEYQAAISEELKEQVKAGDLDIIMQFPDDFADRIAAYEKSAVPDIHIYYNPTEDYSRATNNELKSELLHEYHNHLLEERFGDLNKVIAFTTNTGENPEIYEIKNEKKSSGFGVSQLLPMLLSIMLFASAMGIGMETIAGEKERGTMGAILLTSVSRSTIALGKMIGLAILAIISTLISVIALVASLPKLLAITGGDLTGQLMYGPMEYMQILIILLLEVGIFVGIICLISVLSRSVKEAGTYITPAYMVVMLGAFAAMFSFGKTATFMYAIPLIGNIYALKSALTFELTMIDFAIVIAVSLVVIGILVMATTQAFKSEKVMFNA